jgi:acyl-CoA reductase-like NAD-dependent aldehyde dehydrogenase
MDQKAYVDEMVRKSRAAQAQIAELSQEEVDRMVRGIGLRAYNEAGVCGKMALEETGKGRLETKITKQSKSVMWIWQYLKHAKSVGVVEDIPELALQKIAKPAGVVCCVLPSPIRRPPPAETPCTSSRAGIP